jgi:uncharacterized RDD family membrane protein YckC
MADDDLEKSDPGWPKWNRPGPSGAGPGEPGAAPEESGAAPAQLGDPFAQPGAPLAQAEGPTAQASPWIPIPAATPWGQPGFGGVSSVPPGPAPGLLWGGVMARFGALVVDAVVLFCSVFALGLITSATGLTRASSQEAQPAAATAVYLAWWFLMVIYHPVFWYVFGATPGQRAFGLRIARASDGGPLGAGAVVVRYLVFSVVTVVFPLGLISAIVAANDPYKRAWHDEVARSVVVRRGR